MELIFSIPIFSLDVQDSDQRVIEKGKQNFRLKQFVILDGQIVSHQMPGSCLIIDKYSAKF